MTKGYKNLSTADQAEFSYNRVMRNVIVIWIECSVISPKAEKAVQMPLHT